MTARPAPPEVAPAGREPSGSAAFGPLAGAIDLAARWAGAPLAVIVAGSHASHAAVWVEHAGRPTTLSDLDLYAVVADESAARAAESRRRADRVTLAARREAFGLAAPLEVAFLTPRAMAALPARPGTIELARHGVTALGDPHRLDEVPRWDGRDVPAEERRLLLENRAFDLLLAQAWLSAPSALTRLCGRHAVLRVALDLATVIALGDGRYPDGAEARVAAARPLAAGAGVDAAPLEPLWQEALGWREGSRPVREAEAPLGEWRVVARSWAALRRGSAFGGDPVREAARASLRRRLRQAVGFRARSGHGPTLANRLRFASAGTPQHRVNASGTLVLDALAAGAAPDAIPAGVAAALAALGVVPAHERGTLAGAAAAACRAWDHWLLDGQRTERP